MQTFKRFYLPVQEAGAHNRWRRERPVGGDSPRFVPRESRPLAAKLSEHKLYQNWSVHTNI